MTERWTKQAAKAAIDGWGGDAWAVSISDAVKLLARQPAGFVLFVFLAIFLVVMGVRP